MAILRSEPSNFSVEVESPLKLCALAMFSTKFQRGERDGAVYAWMVGVDEADERHNLIVGKEDSCVDLSSWSSSRQTV